MANEVQKLIDELIKRREAIDITIKTLQAELGQVATAPKKRGRKKGTTVKKLGRPKKARQAGKATKTEEVK